MNDSSRSSFKAKSKASVTINVGNEKYVINTNDPQPLVSLLNQSFVVLPVLKKSKNEYDNKISALFEQKNLAFHQILIHLMKTVSFKLASSSSRTSSSVLRSSFPLLSK